MRRRRFLERFGLGAAAAVTATAPSVVTAQVKPAAAERNSVKAADFGAIGDGVADDTLAIQKAIDAAHALGGGSVFLEGSRGRDFHCSKPIILDDRHGVRLVGNSGPSTLGAAGVGQLVYTGTESPFISVKSSRSISFEGVKIAYNNPAFAGILVGTEHSPKAKADPAFLFFDRCWFTGVGGGRRASALLDLRLCICSTVQNCEFMIADVGINGRTAKQNYSNAIQVTNCEFRDLNKVAITNAGESWLISGCTFEPLVNGTGAAYQQGPETSGWGLVIIGCWMGDTTHPGGCWIDITQGIVVGLSIIGNRMAQAGSGPKDTAIRIGSGTQGVHISGNRIEGAIGIDFTAGHTFGAAIVGNDLQCITPIVNLTNVMAYFVAGQYQTENAMSGYTTFQTSTFVGDGGVRGAINLLPQNYMPTTPKNGDVWVTKNDMYVQLNGVTKKVNLS